MVERIQDLNLPLSNITKIIKDSLPAHISVDKETRVAIARSTSVFIMYLAANSASVAEKSNHKTFSAVDVLDSIKEMEFDDFVGPMKSALAVYRQSMKDKKDKRQIMEKSKSNISLNSSTTSAKEPTADIIEIDDESE